MISEARLCEEVGDGYSLEEDSGRKMSWVGKTRTHDRNLINTLHHLGWVTKNIL
jgi:hypothetical protein